MCLDENYACLEASRRQVEGLGWLPTQPVMDSWLVGWLVGWSVRQSVRRISNFKILHCTLKKILGLTNTVKYHFQLDRDDSNA